MRDRKEDATDNAPGSKERGPAVEQQQQQQERGPGQASPGLKDKEAATSDSYGHTRESGEPPKK
ncbi:MAG TPA: hypothetical protein VLK85_18010 [Ramlibacter sp.]|nr:hypothetical protein [Ramlibacter sp.]